MKRRTGWLLVFCMALSGPLSASPGSLSLIEIAPLSSPDASFPGWRHVAPIPERLVVDMEPGDALYGAMLRLAPQAGGDDRYRVSVQFETSMTINDEGPHIDLLDWQHCRSDWKTLEASVDGRYLLPAPSEAESSCFPEVSLDQLRTAVRAATRGYGGDDARERRWAHVAEAVAIPGEAPSFIGISKVRIRIEARDGEDWSELTTLEFIPPMGC